MDKSIDERGGSPLDASSTNGKQDQDVCILDSAPESFNRLLTLIKGRGYAATWVHVQKLVHERKNKNGDIEELAPPEKEVHQELVILREDGSVFSDAPLPNAKSLKDLDMSLNLRGGPR